MTELAQFLTTNTNTFETSLANPMREAIKFLKNYILDLNLGRSVHYAICYFDYATLRLARHVILNPIFSKNVENGTFGTSLAFQMGVLEGLEIIV